MNIKQAALALINQQSQSAAHVADAINIRPRFEELRKRWGGKVTVDQVYAAMSGLRSKTEGKSLIAPIGGKVSKTAVYRATPRGVGEAKRLKLILEPTADPLQAARAEAYNSQPEQHGLRVVPENEPGWPRDAKFKLGDLAQKKGRASWRGRVVGWYRTELTALGYAIESAFEPGSVQIYPESALLPWDGYGTFYGALKLSGAAMPALGEKVEG